MQHGALSLCSLLAATSQFSVFIGQKMQLTGWHNDNDMCNAICVDTYYLIQGVQQQLLPQNIFLNNLGIGGGMGKEWECLLSKQDTGA